jgi:hypothetical protein
LLPPDLSFTLTQWQFETGRITLKFKIEAFSAADSPNIQDLGIGAGRQYQLNPRAGLFPENNRGGGFKNREDLSLWLMSL